MAGRYPLDDQLYIKISMDSTILYPSMRIFHEIHGEYSTRRYEYLF